MQNLLVLKQVVRISTTVLKVTDKGIGIHFHVGARDPFFFLFLHTHSRPERGTLGPMFNGYRGLFPQVGRSNRAVKLTIHIYCVPRLRMVGLYLISPHAFTV
jgi:hypothetical protein